MRRVDINVFDRDSQFIIPEAPAVIASQNLIIGFRGLIAETCKGASLLMNLIPSFSVSVAWMGTISVDFGDRRRSMELR